MQPQIHIAASDRSDDRATAGLPQPPQTTDTPVLADQPASSPVWMWSDVLLILVVGFGMLTLGLSVAVTAIVALVTHTSTVTQGRTIANLLIECVFLTGSVYVFTVRRKQLTWEVFGLQAALQGWIWAAVGIGLAVRVFADVVAVVAQMTFHVSTTSAQARVLLPQGLTWLGLICITLLGGLVVPFAEELTFRGVLFPFLCERLPLWIALVGSSLLFAVLHLEPFVMVGAFLVGLVGATLYQRTRSLWLSVIVHAVYNTTGLLMAYLVAANLTHVPLF